MYFHPKGGIRCIHLHIFQVPLTKRAEEPIIRQRARIPMYTLGSPIEIWGKFLREKVVIERFIHRDTPGSAHQQERIAGMAIHGVRGDAQLPGHPRRSQTRTELMQHTQLGSGSLFNY